MCGDMRARARDGVAGGGARGGDEAAARDTTHRGLLESILCLGDLCLGLDGLVLGLLEAIIRLLDCRHLHDRLHVLLVVTLVVVAAAAKAVAVVGALEANHRALVAHDRSGVVVVALFALVALVASLLLSLFLLSLLLLVVVVILLLVVFLTAVGDVVPADGARAEARLEEGDVRRGRGRRRRLLVGRRWLGRGRGVIRFADVERCGIGQPG